MRRWNILAAILISGMLVAGCGGGNYDGSTLPPENLGVLDYSISIDPGSTVSPNDITGQLVRVEDALDARQTSALPTGYIGRQGMLFAPQMAPGTGFSGRLRVRITVGDPIGSEYDGVLLYLFYIDPATHVATMLNTGRGDANNYVSFNINGLGYFVIAENSAVARPGSFTVSAYADLANAPAGTEIHFWAVASNGAPPYTFEWSFGDDSQASGAEVSHSYATAGSYSVTLSAVDASGLQAPAVSTPIEIVGGPPGPLSIQNVSVVPDPDDHLHFTYAVTLGGGTGPFTYNWTFDESNPDNIVAGAAAQEHQFAAETLYFGDVRVGDSTGAFATAEFASDARWLELVAIPDEGYAPLTVEFTITALGFAAADEITLGFGDGQIQENPDGIAQHIYTAAGVYIAYAYSTRTTGDDAYQFDSNQIDITVLPRADAPFIQLSQPLLPEPDEPFDIVGYNFGEAAENKDVRMNGFPLDIVSWSDNIVQVRVPDGLPLTGGRTAISINGEAVSNSIQVTLNQSLHPARIQNVIPPIAAPGSRVLITGHGFPPITAVTVAGQAGIIEYLHANGIVAILPGGIDPGAYNLEISTGAAMLTFQVSIIDSITGDIPLLDSITPSVQEIGQGGVTLSGQRFGTMDTAVVYAEGYALPRGSHNSTAITLSDPGPSIDSWACVINRNHVSNALPLAYMRRPQIAQLVPAEAAVGETVSIVGSNFGLRTDADAVLIDGQVNLPVQSWTDSQIIVVVPEGATNGFVTVAKKLESNAVYFVVLPSTPSPPNGGQI